MATKNTVPSLVSSVNPPTPSTGDATTVGEAPIAIPTNPGVLVAATKAGAAMKQYLEELEEMLATPYASPQELARAQAVFTVYRTAEQPMVVDEETGEVVDRFLYLCKLQTAVRYENNAGDTMDFAVGDAVLIALKKNEIRRRVHEQFVHIFEVYKEAIPNVVCAFIPLSNKARAKGWSRPIALKILA